MNLNIPKTMRAARFNQYGNPENVLHIDHIPVPDVKPDEILVKTLLSPIHNHNYMLVQGTYGHKPDLPAGAGTEAVGIVVQTGDHVKHVKKGDKVACGACPGTWAEYFTAPANMAWIVPPDMKAEMAAQISEMPLSSWLLFEFLQEKARLSKGDWLVQNAAAGAVGKILAGLSHERGINILNLIRNKQTCETLSQQGEKTVCTKDPDWIDQAKKIMNGANAKVALDSVSGRQGSNLIKLLNEQGELILFGNLTGENLPINVGDFIFSHRIIRGFWATPLKKALTGTKRETAFSALAERIKKGIIQLPVEKTYPLDAIQEALHASQTSGRKGKILLKCDS